MTSISDAMIFLKTPLYIALNGVHRGSYHWSPLGLNIMITLLSIIQYFIFISDSSLHVFFLHYTIFNWLIFDVLWHFQMFGSVCGEGNFNLVFMVHFQSW